MKTIGNLKSQQGTRHMALSDAEWTEECERNWNAAAAELVADGWERHDYPNSIIPATFTALGTTIYLGRKLGSTAWEAHSINPQLTNPRSERGMPW